jgi:hypothetical protein
MSATARKHEAIPGDDQAPGGVTPEELSGIGNAEGSEYATRGARGLRAGRPQLKMVSPLRAERASRGVFALVVGGLLIAGMVGILVINTSLAQGAFTISELQAQQATLTQQEQTLSEQVAGAAAPESLEQRARSLGMVPSETPVFLSVPSGKVLGQPKAAPGGTGAAPRLLTPADATVTEAVDNASVGTDLPVAPGPNYDPAAVDAAAAQAAAANVAALAAQQAKADAAAKKPGRKGAGHRASSATSQWSDSTLIDVTAQVSSDDAGLIAVPEG